MRGGEEEKVGPVSRSDAFFHAVFTFYRKSFPFQPPPPHPPLGFNSIGISAAPRLTGINGDDLNAIVRTSGVFVARYGRAFDFGRSFTDFF